VTDRYVERLAARIARTGSVLCVGLDPDPAALPRGFSADAQGVGRFARLIVEAAAPVAAAFKPNLAFFEAFGAAGMAELEALRAAVPGDIPMIADAKRGDIGSTAARQAHAIVEVLGADAVTLSPYLGFDAIEPFLARGAFAYVLCRTSNPSAGEVQDLLLDRPASRTAAGSAPAALGALSRSQSVAGGAAAAGASMEPLYIHIARMVDGWDAGRGVLGLVVGATAPEELSAVRDAVPSLPFLVPGVGAQGGSLESALRDGPARVGRAGERPAGLALVNVSRAIAQAAAGDVPDAGTAAAEAAASWALRLRVLDSIPAPQRGSI
jgi:orotidine-5'-phosphate decarboxylase